MTSARSPRNAATPVCVCCIRKRGAASRHLAELAVRAALRGHERPDVQRDGDPLRNDLHPHARLAGLGVAPPYDGTKEMSVFIQANV